MTGASNFAFLRETDIFDSCEEYRSIFVNARIAEEAYFVNAGIFCCYVRRAAELLCKFLEVMDNLYIEAGGPNERRTIGTYLLERNRAELLPAIGGSSNYQTLRQINETVNPVIRADAEPPFTAQARYDVITGLYRLLVWFYRRCGGKAEVPWGFDPERVPAELRIQDFFDPEEDRPDYISEQGRRFIQSLPAPQAWPQQEAAPPAAPERVCTGEERDAIVRGYEERLRQWESGLAAAEQTHRENERLWQREKARAIEEIRSLKSDERRHTGDLLALLEQESLRRQTRDGAFLALCRTAGEALRAAQSLCGDVREDRRPTEQLAGAYMEASARVEALQLRLADESAPALSRALDAAVEDKVLLDQADLMEVLQNLQRFCDEREAAHQAELRRVQEARDACRALCQGEHQASPERESPRREAAQRRKKRRVPAAVWLAALALAVLALALLIRGLAHREARQPAPPDRSAATQRPATPDRPDDPPAGPDTAVSAPRTSATRPRAAVLCTSPRPARGTPRWASSITAAGPGADCACALDNADS